MVNHSGCVLNYILFPIQCTILTRTHRALVRSSALKSEQGAIWDANSVSLLSDHSIVSHSNSFLFQLAISFFGLTDIKRGGAIQTNGGMKRIDGEVKKRRVESRRNYNGH